jgi:hypothetical protein
MRAIETRPAPHRRLAAVALVAACLGSPFAGAAGLRAHEITYRTAFKGIGAGDIQLTLKPDTQPDTWLYETRAFPNFLASFVVNPQSLERSWFRVSAQGVEPLRYTLTDGGSDHSQDTDVRYDWSRRHVTGDARGKPIDLALEPGTQDAMSIRAAMLVELLAGREPREFSMLDGREVKEYVYARSGTAKLKTALGEIDTVIFTSDRKNSDGHGRTWRFWYAPSLDYLPVRIEQREEGQTRLTFAVRSIKWLQPAGAAR